MGSTLTNHLRATYDAAVKNVSIGALTFLWSCFRGPRGPGRWRCCVAAAGRCTCYLCYLSCRCSIKTAIVGQIRRRGSGEQIFHRHLLAELPLDCALRCATQQNDPALHRGSELFGSGRFLVLLHQVNTSWRHENKAGGRQWLLLRLCLAGRTLAVFILHGSDAPRRKSTFGCPKCKKACFSTIEEALACCSDPESSPRPKAPSKTGV